MAVSTDERGADQARDDDAKAVSSRPRPDAGPRRPAFAIDFPRVPELDALVAAFVEGDFKRVREDAPRLVESASDEDVKRAARLLRARIEPDRVAVGLVVLSALLLVFLSSWWIAHGHAPPPSVRTTAPAVAPQPTVEHIH